MRLNVKCTYIALTELGEACYSVTMKTLISSSVISKSHPASKPYEVRDTRVKGFLLRIQPSGAKTFYVEYRRGKRKRLGSADVIQPDKARTEARKILAAAYEGVDPDVQSRKSLVRTLKDYIDRVYEPWAINHLRHGESTIKRIQTVYAKFLDHPLSELSAHDIEKWRADRLGSGTKASTVNRDLGDFKAAYSRAVDWGFIDENALRSVKPCKVDPNVRSRFLDDAELARLKQALDDRENKMREGRQSGNQWREQRGHELYASLDDVTFADHLKPMIILSLNTGLRRGELFSLTWSDIDFDRSFLTIQGHTAKSGKTRHVPLNSEALETLQHWKKQTPDTHALVFTGRDGEKFNNVKKSWTALLSKADIQNFRWHDMRHTFASRLVMAEVDLNTVRELLGHADLKMTLRYAHLAPSHTAKAVEKLVAVKSTG